jgi:hypothetical protein
MLNLTDHSDASSLDLSITPVMFFKDQSLLSPDAGLAVVAACGGGPQGCTCGKTGCSCFYGTGA